MQWYYNKNNQQIGPLTADQFMNLVRSQAITPETLVWNETMESWKAYGEIAPHHSAPAAAPQRLRMAAAKKPVDDPEAGDELAAAPMGPVLTGRVASQPSIRSATAAGLESVTEPLYRSKGWMKFIGVLCIIMGVMYGMTIAGLIVAWLPLWIGIVLLRAARQIQLAHDTQDTTALSLGLENIRKFFKITGVCFLLSLILGLIVVIAAVAAFFLGFALMPINGGR